MKHKFEARRTWDTDMTHKFGVGEVVTVQSISAEFNGERRIVPPWLGTVVGVSKGFFGVTPTTYFVEPATTPDIAHRVPEERLVPFRF